MSFLVLKLHSVMRLQDETKWFTQDWYSFAQVFITVNWLVDWCVRDYRGHLMETPIVHSYIPIDEIRFLSRHMSVRYSDGITVMNLVFMGNTSSQIFANKSVWFPAICQSNSQNDTDECPTAVRSVMTHCRKSTVHHEFMMALL